MLENDLPQVQRLVPWETGQEEFTETARVSVPCPHPTPQIQQQSFGTGLGGFLKK